MAIGSEIEWTEATWNPTSGCTKISPGCKNCYAETLTKRLKAMGQQKYKKGFQYVEHPSDVNLPLTWNKPKKIFVNSMSDLFHENSIFEFTGKCFATMIQADQHDYQILTKRPKRMAEFSELFFEYFGHKIPNFMWMGVSIENQDYVSRIDDLRKVKCYTRFISFEPLIGSVGKLNLRGIDWAIIGGESGHHYRPVQKEWIEEIIEQCKEQDVAVFFKQWGGFRPKAGGRIINRRKYSEYPKINKRNSLKNVHFDESAFAELCLTHEVTKRREKQALTAV
jgi:protein gp37